jgi:hypothetical protein
VPQAAAVEDEEVHHAQPVAPVEPEHQPQSATEPVAERVIEQVAVTTPPPAPAVPVSANPIVLPPGLTQIETDAEKLRIAASRVTPPSPPRPPRVRPPLPRMHAGPLVQVETRKQA